MKRIDLEPSRRVPTQDRSRIRVERILDASAEVFAEVGIEAATTEAIAARAETSIGSLYQFFPNKKAIFYAIVARYAGRVRELYDELSSARPSSFEALVDHSLDALDAFHRSDPGFRAILRNWSSGEFLEADDAINREFARRTEALVASYAPQMSRPRRSVVAEVIVETISSMLILSARRDAPAGAKVIAEAKTLLHRYLAPEIRKKGVSESPHRRARVATSIRAKERRNA